MNIEQAKDFLRTAYKPEVRRSQVALLLGSPGIGKTQCITELAEELGVHAEFLICSQMLPNEICGSGIPSHDGKVWEMYDPAWVSRLKDGDILVLDELLTAGQQILNACLTMCQARLLPSGRRLPDIMIVAAANPLGSPEQLPLAIRQRFNFARIDYDKESLDKYLKQKYGWTTKLSRFVLTEGRTWNVTTPRTLEKLVVLAINAGNNYENDPTWAFIRENYDVTLANTLWEGVQEWENREKNVALDEAAENLDEREAISTVLNAVDVKELVEKATREKLHNGEFESQLNDVSQEMYDVAFCALNDDEAEANVREKVVEEVTDEIIQSNTKDEIFEEIFDTSDVMDLSTIVGTLEKYGLWDNIMDKLKDMEVLHA